MAGKPQILLTNDDGIRSPGLWAAAEALAELGYVWVAAPRDQWSGAGRSMPSTSEGRIDEQQMTVHGKDWTVYAIGGTPAQVIQHALLELLPEPPALAVAGINYGENVGSGVTISGTVGAALEAAAFGIPGLAISLETAREHHLSYSSDVQFSTAAHFTNYFARKLLAGKFPPDVDVLKVDVPDDATPNTEWRITRMSRSRYYLPVKPAREKLSDSARVGYQMGVDTERLEKDSDVYALRVGRVVSVTPLSLDLTSRLDLEAWNKVFRDGGAPE